MTTFELLIIVGFVAVIYYLETLNTSAERAEKASFIKSLIRWAR